LPPSVLLGLLGLPLTPGSIVSALLKGLASWITTGAQGLVRALGAVLDSTTSPPLGAAFSAELGLVARFSAALVPVFLAGAVIDAVLRQELARLGRTLLVRLPVALLGSGAAIEAVLLFLRVTDTLSRGALRLAGTPAEQFVSRLAVLLGTTQQPLVLAGFEAVLLAVLLSAVALLLWVELAVRGAAIAVALLFVPLALAGVLLPSTAHWARRLGETLFALVLSKLVIACVLALGVGSIGEPAGAGGFVEGVALLLLAALSPFTLLRLLPMIEAGAMGHLEGVGRRGLRGAALAIGSIPLPVGEGAAVGALASAPIPMLPGTALGPEFDVEVEQVRRELFGGSGGHAADDEASPDGA